MEHPAIKGPSDQAPLLVIVPTVTVTRQDGRYILDRKAVAGLQLYSQLWPGRVRCVLRESDHAGALFVGAYAPGELPFEVQKLPPKALIPDELISDSSIVLASADNWLDLPIADQGRRLGVPVCFVIEYILETRLQILAMSEASLVDKAKSAVWTVLTERKRRRAFARSSGLQSNGTPAAQAYSGCAPNTLTFFDTRLAAGQMITGEQLAVKQSRLAKGAPLRLAFSGRLEKMKGADDLIEIAATLDRAGKAFRLDIYGTGSLEADMRAELGNADSALREKVHIHQPVDFDRELVPRLRSEVDLFLCCHRQSDPSCTYLETLGCGVPILGYANRAWRGIVNLADVGWMTPVDARDAMVRRIVDLDANRAELSGKMQNAQRFAKAHSFEAEFKRRVDHLWRIAAGHDESLR